MKTPKERIEAIFGAAIELNSPEQRAVYLARVCGDDRQLRSEVDELIQAYHKAGKFLTASSERGGAPPNGESAGAAVVVPVTEKPGDRIGRYKLLQQIGEGGCGVVYMAEQEEPVRRRIALKVIKLGMDTKSVIARFEAERQALALMDHPNIARVFDAGATETGRPYFVMELVRGIKITDYCDQNNLATSQRLDLFIQVCHAIQHAHQKGIIHRDIKPSNILVSMHDGVPVPVVIDFGIAKATEQRLTEKTLFTAFEQFIGTPAYTSPEQAEMSRLDIDTRSDIYSLGVLLYELLTGKTPFDSKELLAAGLEEMRRTIREQEPARPSTRLTQELVAADVRRLKPCAGRPTTDEEIRASSRRLLQMKELINFLRGDLDWIVMKCLEKDRSRQYETANGLALDIERHLSNEPVVARPPNMVYRAQKFIRRNKMMVMAGAAVAAALVLGVVASTWQAMRASRLQAIAETKTEENRERLVQLNVANGARLLNESQAFAALPWLVESLRLEQGRGAGEDLQRRQLGMVLQQCPKLAQIWFHEGPVSCAAFSPDGRRVATGTGRTVPGINVLNKGTGGAQIWDVETGQRVGQPMRHGGGIYQLRFSPDGRRIATASADGTARVWDAESGEPVFTQPCTHSNHVVGLVFSRDGTRLATASLDYTARVWDAQSGRPVTRPLPHLYVVKGVDFSPDGERLVTVSADGWLRVWDAKLGTELVASEEHPSFFTGVQWSPDGTKWVTASGNGWAQVWDAGRGKVLASLYHEAPVLRATFSPDGRRIVTASSDHTARVWDAQAEASPKCSLRHGGTVFDAEFSPDGLAVVTASGDHTARVWDATTGQPLTPSLPHREKVGQAVFSPDGHHLVTVGDDCTACLWELAVGGPFLELNHRLPVTRLALSPDQLRVLTGSADGTAQLWDLKTGEPVGPPLRHFRAVSEVAFSPDGQRLLTAGFDRTALVWEAGSGKAVTPPLLHQEGVAHAAFSPDGRRVATASTDKTAAVWDAITGRPLTPPLVHDREVQWVAFSPDGQRLVTACRDRLARVWDASTGQELLRLQGHKDWVLQAVFSPNGHQILTASADTSARLWDAVSGESRALLRHGWIVVTAAFSADGSRIVTASHDRSARVWDARTGRPVTPPLLHEDRVQQATFSSDGRWVATASSDRTVRLWNATTGDPISPPIRLGEGVQDARFSADGQTLIAASGAAAYVWNLAKEGRPMADLQLQTQFLAGRACDTRDPVAPFDAKLVWRTLKPSLGEPRAETPTAVRAWHRRALAQALQQQDRYAARFRVDRLLDLVPRNEPLLRLRGAIESSGADSSASGWVVSDLFAEARSRIPPQTPETPKNLLDLSNYYNRPLTHAPATSGLEEGYQLSSLPRGVQKLAGIEFDLRGWVQLQGTLRPENGVPERITGIKIARRCRRLHFLHGTAYPVSNGTEIAKYVAHYADGQLSEQPVRYGNDVRTFAFLLAGSDLEEHKDAVRAWSGTNALSTETGGAFRLYRSVWENPRPEVSVESLDFISTMTASAPFLIAITAE